MNRLSGKIIGIESSYNMSIVDIDICGDIFCSVVLETPQTAGYLKKDSPITILFKETEVSLGKNLSGLISLRNRFKGRIKSVEHSSLLVKIILEYKDKEITSVITRRSSDKLSLKEGDEVEWMVKTNEISLFSQGG